jgi:arylsulfatase A-like enzyme
MSFHSGCLRILQAWLASLLANALLLSLAAASDGAAVVRPPNIIVFIVDDLGQRDLGCYGSSFYETPHIDRLAAGGVRLTRAYSACPVCSPTRASLVTGLYPQRTGITDYIGAPQPAAWKRNTRHLPAPYKLQLSLDHTTVAERLREKGYATFFGGKWHLGGEAYLPEDQGFDINRGGTEKGGPYGGKKYFSPYGNPKLTDGPPGEHLPDRLASEAAQFMEQHRDRPFLIWLPFYSVHTPLMARPDLEQKYLAKRRQLEQVDQFADEPPRKVRISQDHAVYAAMVEAMDQAVGKVLDQLTELQLDEQTLVIFTSDNGGLSTSEGSPTSNQPLRAGKGWLYEGGIRTAAVLRWPARLPAAAVNNTPAISCDYVPTILDACRIPLPEGEHLDGVSLLPLMQPGVSPPQRSLFWHYPHYGNQGGAPGAAMLEEDWKLIEWFEDGRLELFHLPSDPSEQRNLAESEAERAHGMLQRLRVWQADVGAIRSTDNPGWNAQKPDGRK